MNDVVDVIDWWTRRAATAAELEALASEGDCAALVIELDFELDPEPDRPDAPRTRVRSARS